MSSQFPQDSQGQNPLRRLRPDDFLTYDELIEALPKPMNKDAIRKLRKFHALPVHRIGVHTMFLGREVIEASARPPRDPDTDEDVDDTED